MLSFALRQLLIDHQLGTNFVSGAQTDRWMWSSKYPYLAVT